MTEALSTLLASLFTDILAWDPDLVFVNVSDVAKFLKSDDQNLQKYLKVPVNDLQPVRIILIS
jgi:hypothetical protein